MRRVFGFLGGVASTLGGGVVGCAVVAALVLVLLALAFGLPALVLMVGWNLALVPLLGFPTLGFGPAVGLVLIVSLVLGFITRR